jgi:hypothetical protein
MFSPFSTHSTGLLLRAAKIKLDPTLNHRQGIEWIPTYTFRYLKL